MQQRVPLEDKNEPLARAIPGLKVWNGEAYGAPDAMWALHMRNLALVPHELRSPTPAWEETSWGMPTLRDYQREGVKRMMGLARKHGGVLIADEMGLGKTVQTLELLHQLSFVRQALVVCPKQAINVWLDETKKWFPSWKTYALVRTGSKKVQVDESQLLRSGARIIITNYELLDRLPLDRWTPSALVLDEAHYIKNFKSGRSKRLAALGEACVVKVGITATPFWSVTQDYWHVLNVLFGPIWGSRTKFGQAYCGAYVNQHGGLAYKGGTPEQLEELHGRMNFYTVRRTKAEVAKELPSLTRQVVWVDQSVKAKQYLHRLRVGGTGSQTFADALKDAGDGKIDAAVELAINSGGRFLCLTYLKEHARQLVIKMMAAGLNVRLITGDTPHNQRQKMLTEMEAMKGGIVGTIDAMNVALNLQRLASVGIMHSCDPVPAKMLQAEARIHRIGSTQPVTWYYTMMRESVDVPIAEKVVARLDQMMGTQGKEQGTAGLREALGNGGGQQSDADVLADLLKELV